jgi:hypothetical protein
VSLSKLDGIDKYVVAGTMEVYSMSRMNSMSSSASQSVFVKRIIFRSGMFLASNSRNLGLTVSKETT